MGQNTGISKNSIKVHEKAPNIAVIAVPVGS